MTILTISNEEMEDIMVIVQSLNKGVSKTIDNVSKEQKSGFLGLLLGALGASLLESVVVVKGVVQANEGTNKAGQDF